MKKIVCIIFAVALAAAHAEDESAKAIRILLNTQTAESPAAYNAAAARVARDAANGKVLQRFVAALLSREKNVVPALRLDSATREEYFESSREKIRLLAERRNNALAYYLLAMEHNDMALLKKAADAGNVQAMNSYAMYLLSKASAPGASTNAVEEATRAGYEYFNKAAARNDPNGLYNLGMCHMRGYSVAPDPEKAMECFFLAARHNHPEAMNNLGGLYRDGIMVARDPVKAARWFAKSADLGNPYGELNYALALLRGEGVVKDEERAVRIFKSSAMKGNLEAMNYWAECLHEGRGVAQDVGAAIRLYRKAADGGLAAAMDNYADCYEQGMGLPKNQDAANIWRMKARAARGDRNAAAWLQQNGVK